MRTRVKAVIVAGLFVGVLGSTSFASATGGDDSTEELRLTSKIVDETEINLGKKRFGLGDKFVFTDDLFRGGKKVGRVGGECTVTRSASKKKFDAQCLVTLQLPKGQLTLQGLITERGEEPFHVAITGGTGAYRDAGGTALVAEDRWTLFIDHLRR